MPARPPTRPIPRALVVTADLDLLDDILRLAAAADLEVDVAHEPSVARSRWTGAALVLVGADAAPALVGRSLPRRDGVVVVTTQNGEAPSWRPATELGAETVTVLPDAEPWLVERLADAAEGPRRRAVLLATLGGRGGAGSSTLAAGLAVTAGRAGWGCLLVDADPSGGGIDLLLGAEEAGGLRWPDLASARGRMSPGALGAALPSVEGVGVLSWDRGQLVMVDPEAVSAVLGAAVRSHDLVVVDLPRHIDAGAREVLSLADSTLLVVPAEVRAVAAARRVVGALDGLGGHVSVVVRGPLPAGVDAEMVADALRLPLTCLLRWDPAVVGAAERGDLPVTRPRAPLALACSRILERVLAGRVAA